MGLGLRHSRFNHIAQDPAGDGWVLYNFVTGRSVRLDAVSYGLYQAAPDMPRSPFAKSLAKAGFLVSGDEMESLRLATDLCRYGDRALMLTVCPTMACNFRCPYCFEEHRAGSMSPQTQDALVEFVRAQLDRFGLTRMCVVWFGGEPLLRPDIIGALSKRLMDLADSANVGYTSNIVTNGYLLTPQNARLLQECRVTGVQVTLDGPTPQVNDLTRKTCTGEGSFDRIVSNLLDLPAGFEVKIRCNVGPGNIGHLDGMVSLRDRLNEAGAASFFLVPGIMDTDVTHPTNREAAGPQTDSGAVPADPDPGYGEVNAALMRLGLLGYDSIGAKMPARFHGTFCGSQRAHTYVVDELGNLYRCWEDCGNVAVSFGNVATCPDTPFFPDMAKATAYMDSAWCAEDPQCSCCPILPVCMGACPHRHMVSGKRRCPWFKDDLDAYVLALARRREEDDSR